MHLVVVEDAQQHSVVHRRAAAVSVPPGDVVHLAPARRLAAAAEGAHLVADDHRSAHGTREQADGPAQIDRRGVGVEHHPRHLGVAQKPSQLRERHRDTVLGRRWRDAAEAGQSGRRDADGHACTAPYAAGQPRIPRADRHACTATHLRRLPTSRVPVRRTGRTPAELGADGRERRSVDDQAHVRADRGHRTRHRQVEQRARHGGQGIGTCLLGGPLVVGRLAHAVERSSDDLARHPVEAALQVRTVRRVRDVQEACGALGLVIPLELSGVERRQPRAEVAREAPDVRRLGEAHHRRLTLGRGQRALHRHGRPAEDARHHVEMGDRQRSGVHRQGHVGHRAQRLGLAHLLVGRAHAAARPPVEGRRDRAVAERSDRARVAIRSEPRRLRRRERAVQAIERRPHRLPLGCSPAGPGTGQRAERGELLTDARQARESGRRTDRCSVGIGPRISARATGGGQPR